MNEYRAIGVFPNRLETENALIEIKSSGFPMRNVSVIGRNTYIGDKVAGVPVHANIDNKIDEFAVADESALDGAVTGGALGGMTGLLVGLSTLAVPGIGPVLFAGGAATALAATLAGTAIGAGGSSLLGGLIGLGVADNEAQLYSDLLEQGYYLIVVDGTEHQISNAGEMLTRKGVSQWRVYDVTNIIKPAYSMG